jgi:prolyl oligopeptidase
MAECQYGRNYAHAAHDRTRRSRFSNRIPRIMDPGANVPKLAYRDGVKGAEHIIIDPGKLATDKAHHYALDWY